MNKYLITAALGLLLVPAYGEDKPELKEPAQRGSYAIGANIGSNFKREGLPVDIKALMAGLADGFAGKPALTEAEMKDALEAFGREAEAKMAAKAKEDGEKNLKAGEEFLAANGKKEGVQTTKSGLQYKVLASGKGKSPKVTDTVKVHYHGTLIDGTVFDSSVDRKEPISIPVNRVIPGWTEALQLMKEGDKWQLYIPAKLAYGEEGPGAIGPNSALLFSVELLSVEKPEEAGLLDIPQLKQSK